MLMRNNLISAHERLHCMRIDQCTALSLVTFWHVLCPPMNKHESLTGRDFPFDERIHVREDHPSCSPRRSRWCLEHIRSPWDKTRQDVITIAWIDNHSHLVYRFGWNIKCYMSLSNPPYPTAQSTYSRDIKFGMESQWGNTFGAIRGLISISVPEQRCGVG